MMDKIPANPDGGLSMLNMIRSGLGTSANWVEGDPSKIGPQEMVSPLGLAPMGSIGRAATSGARTATAPSRMSDAQMAEALTKQFPYEPAVGTMHRGRMAGHPRIWVSGDDGMTNAAIGRLQRASEVGSGTMPTRDRLGFAQNDIFADNAKGSAPGLAANSTQQQMDAEKKRRLLDALMMGSPDA